MKLRHVPGALSLAKDRFRRKTVHNVVCLVVGVALLALLCVPQGGSAALAATFEAHRVLSPAPAKMSSYATGSTRSRTFACPGHRAWLAAAAASATIRAK